MSNDYYYDNYRLADFYDDMYTYDVDYVLWKKYIKPGMRILEIACGTGRLTKLILEQEKQVHIDALDYSKEMLDIFTDKLKEFKVNEGNTVNIINADMRTFTSSVKYDIIIIPSNSLNHIETNEDMESTLENMYSLLKEGGFLLFDLLNPVFEYLIRDPQKSYDGEVYVQRKTGKYFYSEETSHYDIETQINNVTYTYFYSNKKGEKEPDSRIYKMDIKVRLYFPQEINYFIKKSPFESYEKFGWYDGREFNGKTPEQIFVLKK